MVRDGRLYQLVREHDAVRHHVKAGPGLASVAPLLVANPELRGRMPLFIDVVTFGASAEVCARYLAKGRAIAVTGRLIYREWLADDGTRRSKHAVVGRVQFGGKPGEPVTENHGAEDEAATF